MPDWMVNFIIPYVMPTIIAAITPVLSEYVKKAYEWMAGHLAAPVMLAIASAVAEGVNQATQYLSGHSLPYGFAPLVAVFVNTIGNYFGKTPPTLGMPQKTLPEPK